MAGNPAKFYTFYPFEAKPNALFGGRSQVLPLTVLRGSVRTLRERPGKYIFRRFQFFTRDCAFEIVRGIYPRQKEETI
jgi:hypothetical protein